jgi:hypothetical protein
MAATPTSRSTRQSQQGLESGGLVINVSRNVRLGKVGASTVIGNYNTTDLAYLTTTLHRAMCQSNTPH